MEEKKENRAWLSNLDSELVIKNLLFCFLFICLVTLGINYLLLPMVEKYKIAINVKNKNQVILNVINDKFNHIQGAYSVFFNQNKETLNSLHYQIQIENLKDFLEHFFLHVKVKKKHEQVEAQTGFLQTEFEVEVTAKDLQSIQNFFDAIKEAPMNLRVLIPFVIKKQENQLLAVFILQNKYISN